MNEMNQIGLERLGGKLSDTVAKIVDSEINNQDL